MRREYQSLKIRDILYISQGYVHVATTVFAGVRHFSCDLATRRVSTYGDPDIGLYCGSFYTQFLFEIHGLMI